MTTANMPTPANFRITGTTITTISIAWDRVPLANTYHIYRDGQEIHVNKVALFLPARTTDLEFTDTDLWPHSTHTYYVIAANAQQNLLSDQTPMLTTYTPADLESPVGPSNVNATFRLNRQEVDITWDAATDNFKVDHYDVKRNLETIGSTINTRFTDDDPPLNESISYLVVAVDPTGNASTGDNDVVISDVDAPTTPTNLRKTASTSHSVSLAWDASTDNFSSPSQLTYLIIRDGAIIANQSGASGTTYYDATVMPGTRYLYRVKAKDSAGNISPVSNLVTVNTQKALKAELIDTDD